MTAEIEASRPGTWAREQGCRVRELTPRRADWTSMRLGRDLPAGLMVGLVALPPPWASG